MKARIILIALLTLLTHTVNADELMYGWNPSYGLLTINDPNGSTKDNNEFEILSGSLIIPLSKNDRILTTVKLYDFKISASGNNIGQEIENTIIAGYYQREFKMSRHIKPWLGVGVTYNIDKYTGRHQVDSDGFLTNTFSNRSENNLGLAIVGSIEWELNRTFTMGLNAEYLIPLEDNLEGLIIGLSLYY